MTTKNGSMNLIFVTKQIGSSLLKAANGFNEVCFSNNTFPTIFNFSIQLESKYCETVLLQLSEPVEAGFFSVVEMITDFCSSSRLNLVEGCFVTSATTLGVSFFIGFSTISKSVSYLEYSSLEMSVI